MTIMGTLGLGGLLVAIVVTAGYLTAKVLRMILGMKGGRLDRRGRLIHRAS